MNQLKEHVQGLIYPLQSYTRSIQYINILGKYMLYNLR